MIWPRHLTWAGRCQVGMVTLALLAQLCDLSESVLPLLAGGLAWVAAAILFRQLRGLQRLQVLVMLLVGVVLMIWAVWRSPDIGASLWPQMLLANQALLMMLMSVSFLRLVAQIDQHDQPPLGRSALLRTLLGVHLLGAVINFSSMMIMGERMARDGKLSLWQALTLTRGFSLAAQWSPFFVAMGVALTNAPGASLWGLLLAGIPLAALGLGVTAWQLKRVPDIAQVAGFPMQWKTLAMPGGLAAAVLLLHGLWPSGPILALISGLALLMVILILCYRAWTSRRWVLLLVPLRRHVEQGLPGMSGEMLLFMAAGVLAAGISAVVQVTGFSLGIEHFGANQACLFLLLLLAMALLGVHPVTGIATLSGLVASVDPDPQLLGMTFLMSWSLGVNISAFSGTHLAMQGRFGVNALALVRHNASFLIIMTGLNLLALQLYGLLQGLN